MNIINNTLFKNIFSYLRINGNILFICIIAIILRVYKLSDLQYIFDELSALDRLEFNSIKEVIKIGVMGDAHPALVQVFLFYYCKLVGTTEWLVKLPFIICGVASVYVIYDIGKRWFNQTAGLLAATIIACSQFFVLYSTIARPYISGLFLCLLAIKFWLEIVFNSSPRKRDYVYFALFACLSALNHHFSMMIVALCGIFGLFFISKTNFKFYLLACVGAVILYSPHLPILLVQLKIGGVGSTSGGWLDPPSDDFMIRFIAYVFHFSYLFIVAFIGSIVYSLFQKTVSNKVMGVQPFESSESLLIENRQLKIKMVLLLLFTSSFLIGFFYSRKVNPVLQFSTLIFSVPCLILFIASFAKDLNTKKQFVVLVIISVVGIVTLVFERQHYDLLFNQSFDTYMRTADVLSKEKGNNQVYSLFKGEPRFLKFYQKKYNSLVHYEVVEGEAKKLLDYKNLYDTLKANYLLLGNYNPDQLLQASVYYPYVQKKITGFTFNLYVLSKEKSTQTIDIEKTLVAKTDFNNIPQGFTINNSLINKEQAKSIYIIDSLNEYPLSYKIKNTELKLKEGQWVVAELHIKTDKQIKGLLCASTDALGENIHFTGSELEAFYLPNKQDKVVYLSVYVGAKFNNTDNELTFFIWNQQKENFKVTQFSIYTWNTPRIYGLLDNF